MFPTTVWTLVRDAGDRDPAALEAFAAGYRRPVLDFLRARGAAPEDAEDLCQEVFLRILKGGVLAKADRERGRFRALLGTVTMNVLRDRWRKRRPDATSAEIEAASPEPDFDRIWALHLVERALDRLREEAPKDHAVLQAHLDEVPQDRKKLWNARRKLGALVRREVALLCRSHEEIEEELKVLAPWLAPAPPPHPEEKRERPAANHEP